MSVMFPAFLDLAGRKVVVVGGGPVAAGKIEALVAAGARVTVIAPEIRPEIERADVEIVRRNLPTPISTAHGGSSPLRRLRSIGSSARLPSGGASS